MLTKYTLPQEVNVDTKIVNFKAVHAQNQNIYIGSELLPGWERLNYNVRGNSLVYWISPTNVSVDYMKDVDDIRENLSIKSDAMLHFIFTYYTMNDASWVVLVQRLFTKHVTEYIKTFLSPSVVTVDGNDVFVLGKKFSVSIAAISAGVAKFHFGINVENQGAPIPISGLVDLQNIYNASYDFPDSPNPFSPEIFVKNVVENFILELDDILDDSQKAIL